MAAELRWHETRAGRERLGRDRALLARSYPGLRVRLADGHVVASGTITIVQASGERDVLPVELRFPGDYPRHEPIAADTGRRFARDGNNHVNQDGTFCLWTPEESPWDSHEPDALERFLEHLVVYLDKQLVYEVTKAWPGGQRAHGQEGRDDALREIAGSDDHSVRIGREIAARGNGAIGRKSPCPCGSGRAYEKCHRGEAIRVATVLNNLPNARLR